MSTTIIFVPGAWHSPSCFDKTASLLRDAGYKTDYVYLASVGPTTHLKNFDPDVDVIRKHILKALDADDKVILVVHSYGGIPTSQAVQGLDYKTRQGEGKKGGVTHLFFCCSFIIPQGKTLIEAFGGNDLPWFDVSGDKMEVNPMTPETIFYNDLPEDVVQKMKADLKPHSYQTFHSKLEYAGWQSVPSTYFYCLQDNAIPMFVQKLMVEEFAKGTEIRTDTIDASHSPMLSKPKETAEAIKRAAELPV